MSRAEGNWVNDEGTCQEGHSLLHHDHAPCGGGMQDAWTRCMSTCYQLQLDWSEAATQSRHNFPCYSRTAFLNLLIEIQPCKSKMQSAGLEKNLNSSFPFGQVMSQILLAMGKSWFALVIIQLADNLCGASENGQLLALKENLLDPDKWTATFFKP